MKNTFKVLAYILVIFLGLTLLVSFTIGPIYSITCKTWGTILSKNIIYPNCRYPNWWK